MSLWCFVQFANNLAISLAAANGFIVAGTYLMLKTLWNTTLPLIQKHGEVNDHYNLQLANIRLHKVTKPSPVCGLLV